MKETRKTQEQGERERGKRSEQRRGEEEAR